jgi:N-acetylneuraminic acid mutarotase
MPTARWVGGSTVLNNVLYTMGGIAAAGPSSAVEAYDPSTNTWSTKASMPIADDSMYAIAYGGLIYVVGGFNPANGRLANLLSYNPANNTWTTLAPLKVGKSLPTLAAIGTMIISAGGLANSGVTTDNEAYNVASNSWTTLAPLPNPREGACFDVVGSKLYIAGGNPANAATNGQVNTMDAYDANSNAWASGLPTMTYAVVNAGSATIGGRLYCFGGSNNGSPSQGNIYNYVQIYQPPASTPAISAGGVVSASAFGGFASVSPGSWIEIYGSNLATNTRSWAGADFNGVNAPTSLDGTTVTIGGKSAFIDYISPGQINALVSSDTPTGAQQVVVTTVDRGPQPVPLPECIHSGTSGRFLRLPE